MRVEGAGFGSDTNQVIIFAADGSQQTFDLASKKEIASQICDYIINSKSF